MPVSNGMEDGGGNISKLGDVDSSLLLALSCPGQPAGKCQCES